MAKALSIDLRQRVVAAIEDGLSRRQAAARFGVSAASAVRWSERQRENGDIAPERQGGDRRSQRIEAHAQLILDAVAATPDITLAELRDMLMGDGISASIASLWRFFNRRKITLKKRRRTPPSNAAPS
jgi:transposase